MGDKTGNCFKCGRPGHWGRTFRYGIDRPAPCKESYRERQIGRSHTSAINERASHLVKVEMTLDELEKWYQFKGMTCEAAAVSTGLCGNNSACVEANCSDTPWLIDSGASRHMAGSYKDFMKYFPDSKREFVKLADGSEQHIMGSGTIVCSPNMSLSSVLPVPSFPINLLSISCITKELHCAAIFYPTWCLFKEIGTGKTSYVVPPKVFGCVCFVRDHRPSVGKLDPRALKCIFVGYSGKQKGYKCWCPSERRMFVSMDVTFRENAPFYGEPTDLTDVFPDLFNDDTSDGDCRTGGDDGRENNDAVLEKMIVGVIPTEDVHDDVGVIDAGHKQVQGDQQDESNEIVQWSRYDEQNLQVYSRRQRPEEVVPLRHDGEAQEMPVVQNQEEGSPGGTQSDMHGSSSSSDGDDVEEIKRLKNMLARSFEVKDLGHLHYFLGIEVVYGAQGIYLSQRKYVLDLLNETGMLQCRPAATPIEQNHRIIADSGDPVDKYQYQRLQCSWKIMPC